jgi:hypothetical protein
MITLSDVLEGMNSNWNTFPLFHRKRKNYYINENTSWIIDDSFGDFSIRRGSFYLRLINIWRNSQRYLSDLFISDFQTTHINIDKNNRKCPINNTKETLNLLGINFRGFAAYIIQNPFEKSR